MVISEWVIVAKHQMSNLAVIILAIIEQDDEDT